jgi:regulator of protease activity HflC (stomatin/prohibitin superfamily)
MSDAAFGFGVTAAFCGFLLFLVAGGMYGCPQYNVWQQQLAGRAELARADSNRQIATLEAKARHESAKELAQAEIERAKGVAEANKIIGESLHGNEAYLRYLWIHTLGEKQGDVIYVPTEANLPILEATRLAPTPAVER